jgi:hypothetical protein
MWNVECGMWNWELGIGNLMLAARLSFLVIRFWILDAGRGLAKIPTCREYWILDAKSFWQ